ncbi:glutamate racemase [Fimbriimonas ginsengisoli]|uniref:Glutamate racemase n=1 Tax=Fimbriimonas ginsengisoli Gsoil 348 TaxID=661478 RepID=A0A068NVG7_FIMGI|nr:glutamate racemase [Fimbriimonas ginsengisoli]AIE87446.1 glutamate racemase [Fimbriimonas ginsengisoli Gsoil 348]
MRIGVFDSGLGGLAISQAIASRLPEYDYLYLGDTKRVPYGGRSQETIHEFTSQALTYLFENDCELIIVACNTASAEALRKSQQEYLPAHYPDRRVLGVIIPTAEAVFERGTAKRVGVLATNSTVESGAYERELIRQNPEAKVVSRAAPLLVPLIENDGLRYAGPVMDDYLAGLEDVDALVLGCTHYCLLKDEIRSRTKVRVVSQDEVVPEKLADYLVRHPEIETRLGQSGERRYVVTDVTAAHEKWARKLAGDEIRLERVTLG